MLGSIVMAYPLIFSAVASITSLEDYQASTWFPIPRSPTLTHYEQFFASGYVSAWISNTGIRMLWYLSLSGAVAIVCGYVFARFQFRGRNVAFMVLMVSMLLPGIVYHIPLYVMLARWPLVGGNDLFGQGGSGFINTLPALLLPGIVNVYFIFLLRQTFYTIPIDFEEAARVDGANLFQVLVKIYMPMLKPTLAVMVIFQGIAIWNDYTWPLIAVGGNKSVWPIAVGLQVAMAANVGDNYVNLARDGVLLAPTYPFMLMIGIVGILPATLCFLLLQRHLVDGMQGFGLKG